MVGSASGVLRLPSAGGDLGEGTKHFVRVARLSTARAFQYRVGVCDTAGARRAAYAVDSGRRYCELQGLLVAEHCKHCLGFFGVAVAESASDACYLKIRRYHYEQLQVAGAWQLGVVLCSNNLVGRDAK